jgi:hypothetical protein
MQAIKKKYEHAGRPKTGRKLARYWLKESTIAIISERAAKTKHKRDADYLESHFVSR